MPLERPDAMTTSDTPVKKESFDAIVVGGGPAGSTAATVLAQRGKRVALLEKEKFPRYHIGESLMPYCWFSLDRLGLVEAMADRAFTHKHSVQFVTTDGQQSRPFYFFQHYDHPSATTWQVERTEFDQMLFDNAREKGVDARDGVKVTKFLRDGGEGTAVTGVRAVLDGGSEVEISAPVTVDATGREAMAMSKNKWRERDPVLKKVAVWTYFEGAMRDPGLDAGSTTVAYLPEKGWFWYIPLKGDRVSVGIVAERDYLYRDPEVRDPAAIMAREVQENVWIKEHLAPGKQVGEYWTTGEYSYRSRYCADDGLVLAGDAFVFLDPVFSSGVFLALKSGEMAGDAAADARGRCHLRSVSGRRPGPYRRHLRRARWHAEGGGRGQRRQGDRELLRDRRQPAADLGVHQHAAGRLDRDRRGLQQRAHRAVGALARARQPAGARLSARRGLVHPLG